MWSILIEHCRNNDISNEKKSYITKIKIIDEMISFYNEINRSGIERRICSLYGSSI